MIRVLIVEDDAFVREALAALLQAEDGIAVVGQCADGAEVPEAVAVTSPDVVLMDIDMPVISGLEATRRLVAARPSVRVLILTASAVGVGPEEAADAGAAGWLAKGRGGVAMVEAIRTVAGDGSAWPSGALSARS